ncbi:hydrogenase maturation protease [Thermodesulfobium acidiphilum]|uniref:Hydrogenase maturation protease n=1 Tax=Thermodesulfobium acidiphilum TaxID=1794699 RepID=A0A2R4VYU3_THEAF|nr:HyaD/HybD family hydrogenase maturation endopeptidase [Thermodesulfobium acidiphilum]AWB09713.1 hydrogenase maturation protease [Thermodesulfobium acidiphilum]
MKILVIGIGNELQGDDGLGVHVIKELKKVSLPDEVDLLAGGTSGPDLIVYFEGVDFAIFVDAVRGGNKPGTIYKYKPEEMKYQKSIALSPHQIGIPETLSLAEFVGKKPKRSIFFGMEPMNLEFSMELSEPVKEKLPRLVKLIVEEIDNFLASNKDQNSL